MGAVFRSSLGLAVVAVLVACDSDHGVGVSPRTFHTFFAGTVVGQDGEGVSGATVRTTTFLPTVSPRDSIGSCRGLAGSVTSDISDSAGNFVRRISWIQPGPLCLAIEVSAAIEGTPQRWTVSLDSIRLKDPLNAAADRDTLRVFIILTGAGD
jgi:hypothetical protein